MQSNIISDEENMETSKPLKDRSNSPEIQETSELLKHRSVSPVADSEATLFLRKRADFSTWNLELFIILFLLGLVLGINIAPFVTSSEKLSSEGPSEDPLIDRVFPLHHLAQSWETIDFRQYHLIIVSGPQRSGTTWVALQLAKDLNYTHCDEIKSGAIVHVDGKSINCGDDEIDELFRADERIVAQRPRLTHKLHDFEYEINTSKRTLIIFMARNCLDVFRSQNKIVAKSRYHHKKPWPETNEAWTCHYGRKAEWNKYYRNKEFWPYFNYRDMICVIKQSVWKDFQLAKLQVRGIDTATLSYESFNNHPAWISADKRQNFGMKQVSVKDSYQELNN